MSRAAKVVSRHSLRFIPLTLVALFFSFYFLGSSKESLAQEEKTPPDFQTLAFLPYKENLLTESRFTSQLIVKETKLPLSIRYEDDPAANIGTFQTIQEGRVGGEVKTIKITYYKDNEFERGIIKVERKAPVPKIIKRGTKEILGKLETPQGEITYKAKLRVWATSYDKNCRGCNETTATGMRTGYGVIAVDPNIIPLRSSVYIPGYGFAVAGDVGGGVRGAMVDLGFDDVKSGWWSARFTDLYILQ
jgi:3D (Asp-Asp-Asp) domain-containing protein